MHTLESATASQLANRASIPIRKIIDHTDTGFAQNAYGNLQVAEVRAKIANRHGYGFSYEHHSTTRSRALARARASFGPEAAILDHIMNRNVQIHGITESLACFSVVIVGDIPVPPSPWCRCGLVPAGTVGHEMHAGSVAL